MHQRLICLFFLLAQLPVYSLILIQYRICMSSRLIWENLLADAGRPIQKEAEVSGQKSEIRRQLYKRKTDSTLNSLSFLCDLCVLSEAGGETLTSDSWLLDSLFAPHPSSLVLLPSVHPAFGIWYRAKRITSSSQFFPRCFSSLIWFTLRGFFQLTSVVRNF